MFLHPIVIVVVVFLFFFYLELVSYQLQFFECNHSIAYCVLFFEDGNVGGKSDKFDIVVLLIDKIHNLLLCTICDNPDSTNIHHHIEISIFTIFRCSPIETTTTCASSIIGYDFVVAITTVSFSFNGKMEISLLISFKVLTDVFASEFQFNYSIRLGGYRNNHVSLVLGVFLNGWWLRQTGQMPYVRCLFFVVYIICSSIFHTFLQRVHKPVLFLS